MPELPDVELFKRYLESTALHHKVKGVTVDRGDVLLEGVSERRLAEGLRGHELADACRHGKWLFVELDDGAGALVLHFGMTGYLAYYKNDESAPHHERLVLDLDDGSHLAYSCQRLFGKIGLVDRPATWIEQHHLGPDALALDADGFAERLAGRRGTIKSALMNQSVIAGIGNIYSDEILFRARLHPETEVARLHDRDVRALYRATHDVLEGAIRYRVDPARMPRNWLLPRRKEGARCPRCGGAVRRLEVAGRSAWVCERCQETR